MIGLGLRTSEQRQFQRDLVDNHDMRIRVFVMDLQHKVTADLSDMLLDGQVNVDAAAKITRNASLDIFDPERSLSFDTNSPLNGSLYMDRMIQIRYGIRNPDGLNRWIDVPIFTGPITQLSRNADVISIECQGKEILAQEPCCRPRAFGRGTKRIDIIESVMRLSGERKFDLMDWSLRSTKDYALPSERDTWSFAKSMAGDNRMFYDGRGNLVVRPRTTRSVFTFTSGDNGSVLTAPKVDYSTDDVRNYIRVTGGIPKGAKLPVSFTAIAYNVHPLSPFALGRNGEPRYLPEFVEESDLMTVAACKEVADRLLASRLLQGVVATFDAVPIINLEPWDVVEVSADDMNIKIPLLQYSIPLTAGSTMSVGYKSRRVINKARIRRVRR